MDTERFQKALALRDSGREGQALNELREMFESATDPEERSILLAGVALSLQRLGHLPEARRELNQALRIAPRTYSLMYLMFQDANLCSSEGRWKAALEVLDRLQSDHGELLVTPEHRELNGQIQLERGVALRALGRCREGAAALAEALSLGLGEDDRRRALFNLGACYADLKETEGAKKALGEALCHGLQGADAATAHYYLGTIYYDDKAFTKALVEFESSLRDADGNQIPKSHLYGWLAATACGLGRMDDAERYKKLAAGSE
jgi:tetratricopeptide (TPR) repeat protein